MKRVKTTLGYLHCKMSFLKDLNSLLAPKVQIHLIVTKSLSLFCDNINNIENYRSNIHISNLFYR